MNLKRICLFLVLISMVAVGTMFAQTVRFGVFIEMKTATTGLISFADSSGRFILDDEPCWFKSTTPIEKGKSYTGAITRMATKTDSVTGEKRPGIIIREFGNRGIFIHEGNNVSWSDNCIVLKRDKMMIMWNYIKNAGFMDQYVISIAVF